MSDSNTALLDEILYAVELMEFRGLVWGDVDASIHRDRLLEVAAETARARGSSEDPDDLIEELVECRALFELPSDDSRCRSRFAELTRLLVRLRQQFRPGEWATGANLVSDFRVHHSRRRYPVRDVPAADALQSISADVRLTALQKKLWAAAAWRGDGPMNLAAFQVDATSRILRGGNENTDTATMITAGTGSGKTLAFYLPALLRIGERIGQDNYTQALVIYPRTELLKDQFAETYDLARQIDDVLSASGRRPLSIGALFSNVPSNASQKDLEDRGWRRSGAGWACPLMCCRGCGGPLVWSADDLTAKHDVLRCFNRSCKSPAVSADQMRLTRNDVKKRPPDILFTTTEMLNQRLSDPGMRHVFGIGQPTSKRPHMLLLDEVHTYAGTSGAQTALTLRRWRQAVRSQTTWVGLSATLEEPAAFFGDLTGVNDYHVQVCEPLQFVEEGADYQLLLKADPSEMASVLSTSIQTVMAMARLADNPKRPGPTRFGRRLFVFTDDLDVTNRLFDDIRDAEGYSIFGRHVRPPLAALRTAIDDGQEAWRDAVGQRWWAAERLDRDLQTPLRVTRTTSTDRGVDLESDVIVATAALEVGINDSEVGAVLQHKAPRDLAAYLQRKGRAGRSRKTRPALVTVLSDHGRDRIAFQQYEHLFSPRIPARRLPIRNQYVLRMQAVNATLDWLSHLKEYPGGWAWWVLSTPPEKSDKAVFREMLRTRQPKIHAAILRPLLRGEGPLRDSLRAHLKSALGLEDGEVEDLLWQPPRPLLLEVLPTLSRRLFSEWKLQDAAPGQLDHHVVNHPLPDFIPRSLFGELSLPEVSLTLPPATVRDEVKVESMALVPALRHLAPGRVTRRFAEERGKLSHWVPIELDQPLMRLPIDRYAAGADAITEVSLTVEGTEFSVPVFRPWSIELSIVKSDVARPSSNSRFEWHRRFRPNGDAVPLPLPQRSAWREILREPSAYLHRFDSNVAVTRFAHRAVANVVNDAGRTRVDVRLDTADGKPAAVGFELEVDALRVDLSVPSGEALASQLPPALLADLRAAHFRECVLRDEQLPDTLSVFDREALRDLLFNALVRTALNEEVDLARALRSVLATGLASFADDLFAVRFGDPSRAPMTAQTHDDEQLDEDGGGDPVRRPPPDRTRKRLDHLRDLASDPATVARLGEIATALWDPVTVAFGAWLRSTLIDGLAAAILQACIDRAPMHAATDSLLVDSETTEDGGAVVWISESTLGGGGVVSSLADCFHADPNELPSALEAVLAPANMERSADALEQVVRLLSSDDRVRELARDLRASADPTVRARHRAALYSHLADRGLPIGHSIGVSLQSRVFRPGSSDTLDTVIMQSIDRWDGLQRNLGVALSLREFAYATSWDPGIVTMVVGAGARGGDQRHAAFATLESVLWPRGGELRGRILDHYHPFQPARLSDPGLLREVLVHARRREVDVTKPEWRQTIKEILETDGSARLVAERGQEAALRAGLIELLASPVDCDYLQFFPAVERIDRGAEGCSAVVSLKELL